MEDRSRALSNEFLFESSNEYCLNCFINGGENRMRIKENFSNFGRSLSNELNKLKDI